MSNLTYIGRPDEETDSNYFKEAMTKLIENMLNKGDLSIELRMRAIEQILFKTSSEDRNRLFDHIYEKIDNAENRMTIEN